MESKKKETLGVGGVFYVFAGALFSGLRFGLSVGIGLQHLNRLGQVHGFAPLGSLASSHVPAGLHGGQVPLQAAELDFQVMADVKGRYALRQSFERETSLVQAGTSGEQRLQLRP